MFLMFPLPTYHGGSRFGIQSHPHPQKEVTPARRYWSRPPHAHVCLQPHATICGLAVNPAVAPAKQSVPLSARMPQEEGKLPPGWQPFLFPAPFRTSETNQDTERGLYNVCTNNASPDKVRKRKMPEMSMVVQVEAKKLKSNGTSTKPLKRTPIPRAKHNWKTHGH